MAILGSTTSSMTSTSHTMTVLPSSMAKGSFSTLQESLTSDSLSDLLQTLARPNRQTFIAPPIGIVDASLVVSKRNLDVVAGQLGDEQVERQKESRRKRKRGERIMGVGESLKIRRIHTEEFETKQVWEQSRRVIDAIREDAERAWGNIKGMEIEDEDGVNANGDGGLELLEYDDDGLEVRFGGDCLSNGEQEEVSGDGETREEFEEPADMSGEDSEELPNDLKEDDDYEHEGDVDDGFGGVFVEDPHGLNDGFFSIDEFNKQTEFLEQQDAAADPYTGEASDEEDIDWDADPMTIATRPTENSRRAVEIRTWDGEDDEDEEMEDEDGDGPTFGNMNLSVHEGNSDDGDGDSVVDEAVEAVGDNTNEILYKEFFEPPPRKAGKGERQANYLARQGRKRPDADTQNYEANIERAMADVRRDLFNDGSDQDDSEDALSRVDPSDPKSRRSTHERRQAKLAEEIRRLEAASVAKREWALSGEARAVDRPMNSLIEENLDFEHTGKPVLEVTAEISESIEELIKRRILSQEFDEVIRRRPDASGTGANTRRGTFELDDSKPQQSLAEIYEEGHVKVHNPDTYISKADEKTRKEEKEIEALWKDVTAKLDALSSWHYKPKPAAPSLTVVADVPTVSMEDAQPATASGINGGESMLAPQEIYMSGKEKESIEKGEVVPKSGVPVARQEMTREEKLRRRRREKERTRKRGGLEATQKLGGKKAQQKREVIGELKKGGVKVIDRKGNVRDVDGNRVQAAAALKGAGAFKL
jgi:U3 small nucleolar RNA-associated protein MPP10